MQQTKHTLTKPSLIALAALCVLLILALVFFKDRFFFADTSFVVFRIINFNQFAIMNQRYGSFVTQIIPYLSQNLHCPISIVLIGSAISFHLFFLTIAGLLVYRYKHFHLALLMVLYFFLFVSDSFFLANDEIHQAVTWMFLFYSITIYLGNKKTNITLLLVPFLLLAFITFSTHFIVIIPTAFLWVYFLLEKERWPFSKNISILLSGILIAIVLSKYITTNSSYDNEHLHGVTHFSLQDIIDSFSKPIVRMFFYRCITNYWVATIVFIIGLSSLFRNKQIALMLWTLTATLGYIIIMGLTYPDTVDTVNNLYLFHLETEWSSIGIIVATPFVFSFLPKIRPAFASWSLTAIFLIRILYICNASTPFHWRTTFKEKIFTQMKHKNITKLAIYRDDSLYKKCILDWALPFETLMASALNNDKPQLFFFFVSRDDKRSLETIKTTKYFYNPWGTEIYSHLNSSYFSIDTTQPYQIMTYEELFK